ncbi:hypothetical protein LAZ67_2004165 [Cordylochernes scorpioides]|uniref:DUF7041 domain-containing protein n=1 Tax=Cordylochernes scorpioides TaxID=51811 RepID=A0ABY6K4P3_9ARAC|nr:hypothetical protein LAZ67_2004165 [Cordylochernes scorpioides]
MKSEETEKVETYKVNIKLPPFWIERPDIWFHQVEAQFLINNIKTENTKFNYLIAQLEPKYVENLWDIITSKEINKYSEAKERLLGIFEDGELKRIRKLLSGIELGDLKPSQLLQKLKSLATEDLSDKFIKTLWLEKLPQAIQKILIISEEELDKLAVMADRIAELNPKAEIYEADKPENKTKMLFKKNRITGTENRKYENGASRADIIQRENFAISIIGMEKTAYLENVKSHVNGSMRKTPTSKGREDVNDEERAGRPSTSTTDEKINEVEKMILANRRITVREVSEDLNISIGSCHSIFINDLGMRRVAAKFVPKLLNCNQKQHRMNIANEMLDSVRDDPNLLQRVITGDEAWVYGYDVETKAQSSQWKLPHEPRPKKARQVRSNVKVLLTVFFDCRGVVHHEFLPQGRTVNK